jgi:hypothetical protein
MSLYDKLSESLSDEVMTDMAEEFFGARRALEEDLEFFGVMVERLKARRRDVQNAYAVLRRLLLDDVEAEALMRSLGLEDHLADLAGGTMDMALLRRPPRVLYFSRRYARALFWAYSYFYKTLDAYRHGQWRDDPRQKGRKTLSVHYEQAREFCRRLNERIEDLNTHCSPACALQRVKSMDPEQVERERITGATFTDYACGLDDAMAFKPVEFPEEALPEYCDAPEPKDAEKIVLAFGLKLARRRRVEARGALRDIVCAWREARKGAAKG